MENEETSTKLHPALGKLWDAGIPVKSAIFQAEVDNANGIPNIKYDLSSGNKERRIDMVLTPQGLLCKQADERWLVPHANLRSIKFK